MLRAQLPASLIEACRAAFWPLLHAYLKEHSGVGNRGPRRHFLPMPFEPPCFAPDFFFNPAVLTIVKGAMDDRIVADQWGCDVPLQGSDYQEAHVDYRRPLFAEAPDLPLPCYMLVVSFGLIRITNDHGPIEIAPGTHRRTRRQNIEMQQVPLEIGDVLIRHPWALHRGTPNKTETPRALVTIRYVRRWYTDGSREANPIPKKVWDSLTPEQRGLMRFTVATAAASTDADRKQETCKLPAAIRAPSWCRCD